ncbi:hypothetical protein [Streptomyces tubercidicus]|uniref:hypothetical protein n=1 Tax=Streptomyces tubercidicus TaxID=47759 RepID=UPI0036B6CBA2
MGADGASRNGHQDADLGAGMTVRDARSAPISADQARIHHDLEPVRPDAEAAAELKIPTARRADLVAMSPPVSCLPSTVAVKTKVWSRSPGFAISRRWLKSSKTCGTTCTSAKGDRLARVRLDSDTAGESDVLGQQVSDSVRLAGLAEGVHKDHLAYATS